LIALPFLAIFMALGAQRAGIFTWYSSGDDWWTFQRLSYRIYMQGYWLEGGERTFWFQPLYRWVLGAIAVGVHLIALRTWHYTGIYSMLHGTSTGVNTVWKAGESLFQSLVSSVLMVLTMNDPPRFDVRAVPVLFGFAAALLGLAGLRPFARLPLHLVVLCMAGIAGALVVRASTYPGRFSIHMVPVTVTLAVCAIALLLKRDRVTRSRPPAPQSPGTT
jgi:hypothetical protein